MTAWAAGMAEKHPPTGRGGEDEGEPHGAKAVTENTKKIGSAATALPGHPAANRTRVLCRGKWTESCA